MSVSKNNGTPKSSILIGFSIINHPLWGTPIFGNIHIIHGNGIFTYINIPYMNAMVYIYLLISVPLSSEQSLQSEFPDGENLRMQKTGPFLPITHSFTFSWCQSCGLTPAFGG